MSNVDFVQHSINTRRNNNENCKETFSRFAGCHYGVWFGCLWPSPDNSGTGSATGGNSKDAITLKWYYGPSAGAQAGEELVEEEFNKILHTFEGMEHVNVDFVEFHRKQYKNEVTLAQSSKQQIDLISTHNLDLAEQIGIGTLLPLDGYIEDSKGLKALPDWIWEMAKGSDNKTYIVPHYQRPSNRNYLIIPKVWADKYGDVKALQKALYDHDLEAIADWSVDFLEAVRKGEGVDTKYLMPMGWEIQTSLSYANHRDTITGSFVVENNSSKVENIFMTADMLKAYEISAEWYEKGYIHPDVLTFNSTDAIRENMMNPVSYVISCNNGGLPDKAAAEISAQYEFDVVVLPVHDEYFIPYTWAAGGTGVTQTCKYPTEAFRVIELMNSEEGKALFNTMYLGVEGVHWNKTGDGTAETLTVSDNKKWVSYPWAIGNATMGYKLPTETTSEQEIVDYIQNSEPITSDLAGFVPDLTYIQTQLEQIKAVETEYKQALYTGAMGSDWEDLYNDFVAKMINAGLNDVLEELQNQVDDFLAKKAQEK